MSAPNAPSREQVLQWMRDTGNGYTKAEHHFGLNPQNVKSWQKRNPLPPVVLTVTQGKPKGEKTADPNGPPPRSGTHARVPASQLGADIREDLRRCVRGLSRYLGDVGDASTQEAAAGRAAWSVEHPDADPPEAPDMQQAAHAARALDIMIARVPDLMTFEAATAAPRQTADAPPAGTPEGDAALVERLSRLPPHVLTAALARRTG